MKLFIVVATLLLVSAAHEAAAQGFVSPFVDTTLSSPSAVGSSSKPGFGIAFGALGKIIGGETEIAYQPELIDNTANALAKSRVITFSGNTLIGPTIGRVKVYGEVGVGDLYLNVTKLSSIVGVPNPASISTNYFTVNVGGGVMGFFTKHMGVRADVRYFRAFGFKVDDLQTAGLVLDRFDFWRASVGFAAKF
jgi:opacity protein-like surface antigen